MKHHARTVTLGLLLFAAMQPALAASAVQAQTTNRPPPAQPAKESAAAPVAASGLKKIISLQAGSTLTLPTALAAIARSSGLNLFERDVPPLPLTQSLKGLTGQQALDLILTVYGDTIGALVKGNTLIVGQKTFISALSGDAAYDVVPGLLSAEQAATLSASIQGLRVVPFGDSTLLVGSAAATSRGRALLSKLGKGPAPAQTDSPVVHADVLVSPLAPGDAVEAVKAAWPSLRVAGTPTRVLLSGSSGDVKAASELLGRLQADALSSNQSNLRDAAETSAREQAAREAAAKLAQAAQQPAPPAPPAPILGSARLALDLQDAVVMKLAGSMDTPVKAALIQEGLYTVSGEQRALDAFTAAALELQQRNQARPTVAYAVRGSLDDAAASLRQLMPSVNVALLRASRQLLISASPDEHSRVVLLLKQVDRPVLSGEDDVVSDIVRLSYAQASTVVSTLGAGAAGAPAATSPGTSTPGASVTPAAGSPAPSPASSAPGLSVSADTRTNAVILSGPRRQVEQARRVLQSLDVALPNINIGLNVRQVSNSDGTDLGVNWKAGLAGVTLSGGAAGLSVGYAPAAAAPSINIDLAANQNRTTSTTLLDTSLTTQAGRASTLLSGGQLLVPVTNTTSSGGATSSQQSRESYTYGLDIAVTPRLAPDGTVELTVALTIGEKPVTDANGNIDIAKRTVTTVVTVRPGQAVTLGGLVSSAESAANSGVPLLSAVPILGALFGRQSTAAGHTVLLITLTAAPDQSAAAPSAPPPAPAGVAVPGSVSVTVPAAAVMPAVPQATSPQTVNRGDGASSTTIPASK